MGRQLDLHLLTDSRSAFHIATTLVSTREKRLMLDVHLLREAYERREVTKITWISGLSNVVDPLTKRNGNGTLLQFVQTNQLDIHAEGWVDRDPLPVHTQPNNNAELPKNTLDDAIHRMGAELQITS